MTPTPPSTTSSSMGAHSPDGQYRVVRKRNRVPLSCAPCRHRKLKCNRTHPCENCFKRGDAASCSYTMPSARKRNQSSSGASNSDEMQNRIDRLEGLVLSLMTNGAQSAGPSAATAALAEGSVPGSADASNSAADDEGMTRKEIDSDESDMDRVTNSFGVLKVDATKTMYFGESHWATILNDISEVKNYFKEHKKQIEEQYEKVAASKVNEDVNGPPFMFNTRPPPARAEILAALPQRPVVDQIISRYFNSSDPALHIIHGPSFHRDYEDHWRDPSVTPIVWLAQLFAIMRLAMQSYHRAGDEPVEFQGQSLQLANAYRNRTVECLLRAEFCRSKPPMLETLILHLQGEHTSSSAEVGSWVMGAMIVRLAMRMGYHRDPKFFPEVTAFHGELRRRVWTFVRMVDILLSFQLGLPSMIRPRDCDTDLPRNLYDEEIDESTQSLPPSRPITEPTPVSYMIAKAHLAFVFGEAVELMNALHQCSYEEVMSLDHKLRAARDSIPLHLRLRSMEESRMDPASLIIQRFSLELLYHKSQCVLHKKFAARARANTRYTPSRHTCIDSCLDLMSHQATIHRETLPHGRLRSVKWFINSVTSHDFLLAAMIVCLDLYHGNEAVLSGQSSSDPFNWEKDRHSKMVQALETSNAIWKEFRDQSIEAYKANELLTVMLEKLRKTCNARAAMAPDQTGPNAQPSPAVSSECLPTYAPHGFQPEHTAAITLGLLSSGGVASNPTGMFDRAFSPTPSGNVAMGEASGLTPNYGSDATATAVNDATMSIFTMLGQQGNMIDMPANYEWDAWDSYIQGAGFDPANQMWSLNMDLPAPGPAPPPPIDPQVVTESQRPPASFATQSMPPSTQATQMSQQPTLDQLLEHKPPPLQQQQPSHQHQHQQQRRQRQQVDSYPNAGGIFMGADMPINHNSM